MVSCGAFLGPPQSDFARSEELPSPAPAFMPLSQVAQRRPKPAATNSAGSDIEKRPSIAHIQGPEFRPDVHRLRLLALP